MGRADAPGRSGWAQSTTRAAAAAGLMAAAIAAVLFAATLQTHVNGSGDAYVTDVGEIQNALPRWGTIHFTGYPLYSLTGSALVTAMRRMGAEPAAAASAVSMLWGIVAVGLVAALAVMLDATVLTGTLAGVMFAAATSMWMDASLAEVHTLTMAFTAALLVVGVAYRGRGGRVLAYGLTLAFCQGVLHMRPVVLLAPALAVLVWPRRRELWRCAPGILAIAVLSPLVYLYMPLREWSGATWTFGETGTWHGFWAMLLDTKADRIVHPVQTASGLVERLITVARLLNNDVPAPLLALGVVGLLLPARRRSGRALAAALALAWLPYALLMLVIWEGRVSDALLAVKLPVVMLACVGLALIASLLARRGPAARAGYAAAVVLFGSAVGVVALRNAPKVTAITHDDRLRPMVRRVDEELSGSDGVTLLAPWGHTYWAMAYEQAYDGKLANVHLVDHNADLVAATTGGGRLVTPSDTLYVFPKPWWESRLGPLKLHGFAPGLVEVVPEKRTAGAAIPPSGHAATDRGTGADAPGVLAAPFAVNADLSLLAAEVTRDDVAGAVTPTLTVHVVWRSTRVPARDYSVAVHLLAADPPEGPEDVLAQADAANPVDGWSPTSGWAAGERVPDYYALPIPPGSSPVAVRVTAYYAAVDGSFVNGNWLSLPVPAESARPAIDRAP